MLGPADGPAPQQQQQQQAEAAPAAAVQHRHASPRGAVPGAPRPAAASPRVQLERVNVGPTEVTRLRLPANGPAYQAMHAMLQRRRQALVQQDGCVPYAEGAGGSLGHATMSLPPGAVLVHGNGPAAEPLLPALSA